MNNQELRIEILLEEVVKKRASDLHIQVGLPPMLRIDGALVPAAGTQPLDEPSVERLVFQILDEDQRQILLKDKEFDFSFAFGGKRLKGKAYYYATKDIEVLIDGEIPKEAYTIVNKHH